MNWYYEDTGKQAGPITESQLRSLHQEGTLADGCLVWNESMIDWQPYSQVMANSSLSQTDNSCAYCGKPTEANLLVTVEERPCCPSCVPTVVQRMREGVGGNGQDEAIRKEHLKHEASIKSVGLLYYMGAAFLIGSSFVVLRELDAEAISIDEEGGPALLGALVEAGELGGMGLFQFVLGFSIKKLKSWTRIPAIIISCIELILSFPIGTIIHGYILYLLLNKKGKTVLSSEYAAIVQRTPQIREKSSLLVLVFIILWFLAVIVGIGV